MAPDILNEAISQRIKSFVENIVSPQVKRFAEVYGIPYKSLQIPTDKHFEDYLKKTYEKYSIINTLVFHNSQRLLKDVYVTQTLVKKHNYDKNEKSIKIDQLPLDLIREYKRILITDTAGMGKSTILKRMFIDLIDNDIEGAGIPIYIELNRLNDNHSIMDEIQDMIAPLDKKCDSDMFLRFIKSGGFIFFLDGYDEITITDTIRRSVTQDIQSFISEAGTNNYYILTSRPEGNLPSFGDFQSFSIKPLSRKDAYELLGKYDLSEDKELSKKLIGLLKSGQYRAIDEYLTNPLLVSLLYTAYDYNRSIPLEKHNFYGVVFEAFFEKHDSSKSLKCPRIMYSKLNRDGFDRILRHVGFTCLVDLGVQFSEDSILNAIREARSFCVNLDFSESDFLKDLITSVPLFCHEGNVYKWVHKSLLEYFAARYIFCDAKLHQDEILTGIYHSDFIENYINMLDIYYDIDYKGFLKNISLPLCEKYLNFHDELMKEFNNVIQSQSKIKVKNRIKIKAKNRVRIKNDKRLVEERIGLLFMVRLAYYSNRHDLSDIDKIIDEISRNVFKSNLEKICVIDSFLHQDRVVWIANTYEVVLPIVRLLYQKNNELFVRTNPVNNYNAEDLHRVIISCINNDHGKYSGEVSVGHCYVDNRQYTIINSVLARCISSFRFILSYESCENEVKRIKKEIAKSKESQRYKIR